MFKALGLFLGLYVAYAAYKGEVYAKSGAWGRAVMRTDSLEYFWMVIVVYAGLSIALITLF